MPEVKTEEFVSAFIKRSVNKKILQLKLDLGLDNKSDVIEHLLESYERESV
jgi:hypothetical protein